jgi:threonine/homoserine/homoserine lactone efflux protein
MDLTLGCVRPSTRWRPRWTRRRGARCSSSSERPPDARAAQGVSARSRAQPPDPSVSPTAGPRQNGARARRRDRRPAPSALAVALSPIPIVAIVVVLGAAHARTAGPAFALGWIAGLAAVSVIVVLVLGGGNDTEETGVNWFKVAIGLVFWAMAAQQWQNRPKPGEAPKMPSWMASIGSASPATAALLGDTLSAANPKNLALTLAASAPIAEAELTTTDTAIAVAAFVVIGSATVAGAVLFYLAAPAAAARPLAAIKQFMSDNNAVIMMVVLLLLGAKLLGDGLAGIWH